MATTTKHRITADTSQWERAIASMRKSAYSLGNDVKRDLGNMNKGFDSLGKSILGANSGVAKLAGGFATFAAAGSAFAVMGDAVNTIKDFEKANSTLKAISGATADEMEGLTAQAKMLGSTTAYSASQVTSLQTELAKLGFQVPEIKASTDSILKLASATGAELGESASLAGATLRAFGLDASEMGRVASVLAVSTTKSALSFEKLNNGMSTVAPVAKAFGFSVEDTVAMLGKLSDAGFDASSAATATRNIFLNLANSNGKLAKALGRPVHNAKELADGLVELRNKGVDLNEALAMTDKRSVAAFETFLANAEGVAKLSEELTGCNKELDNMVSTMTDNLQGSIDSLSSSWEGFLLSLSGSNGIIRDVVDAITTLVQGLTKLMQTEEEYAKGKATAVIAEAEARRSEFVKNEKSVYEGLVKTMQEANEQQKRGLSAEQIKAEAEAERKKSLNAQIQQRKSVINALEKENEMLKKAQDITKDLANPRQKIDAMLSAGISMDDIRKYRLELDGMADKRIGANVGTIAGGKADLIALQAKLDVYAPQQEDLPKPVIKADVEIENEATIRQKIKDIKKEMQGYDYHSNEWNNLKESLTFYEKKLDEITGKEAKIRADRKDAPSVNLEYQNLLTSNDVNAIQNALDSMDQEIFEYLAKGGELAGAAWMDSFRDALTERLDALRFNEALAKELGDAGDEYQKKLSAKAPAIQYDQSGMRAYSDLISGINDGLGEYTDKSKEANVIVGLLSTAQSALNAVMSVQTALTEASTSASNANALAKEGEATSALADATAQGADATASVANASAKSAEAITGATASGAKLPFPANIAAITAGISVVVAMLSMAKSFKFANGGIVGGTSYAGDKVPALLNSGEMVLNQNQQSSLFRLLNGGGGGRSIIDVRMSASGKEMKGTIKNYDSTMNRLK